MGGATHDITLVMNTSSISSISFLGVATWALKRSFFNGLSLVYTCHIMQSKIKIGPILHQLQSVFASKGQIAYAILTVMSTINLALGSAGNNLSAQYMQEQGCRSSGVL